MAGLASRAVPLISSGWSLYEPRWGALRPSEVPEDPSDRPGASVKQAEESPRPRQDSQMTASMICILPEDGLEARTRRK